MESSTPEPTPTQQLNEEQAKQTYSALADALSRGDATGAETLLRQLYRGKAVETQAAIALVGHIDALRLTNLPVDKGQTGSQLEKAALIANLQTAASFTARLAADAWGSQAPQTQPTPGE